MAARQITTAAEPRPTTFTQREVAVSIAAFVVLCPAWTGFRWLVHDHLGWSMWVVVGGLGLLALAGALVFHRATNPDLVIIAQTVWILGLIGGLSALAEAIDRSEILVIWVAVALLGAGRLVFRLLKRR